MTSPARPDLPDRNVPGAPGYPHGNQDRENSAIEARTAALTAQIAVLEDELRRLNDVESELRTREARLQSIIEMEPACVKLLSADGRLLEINRAGLRMLEADSLEQVARLPLRNFILPEWHEAFAVMHGQILNGGSAQLEFRIQGLHGTCRWVESRAVAITDSSGNVTSVLAITRDITETRAAQESLRQSEMRFRSIFEQAAVGMMQHDDDTGAILKVNDRLCRILQRSRQNLVQQTVRDVFPACQPAEADADVPDLELADSSEGGTRECVVGLPAGGLVWLRLTASAPASDPGSARTVTTVVEDISQRRRHADLLIQRDLILRAVAVAAAQLLTAKRPERVMQSVLRELGRATRSNRASWLQKNPDGDLHPVVTLIAEWCDKTVPCRIDDPDLQTLDLRASGLMTWDQLLRQGQPVQRGSRDCSDSERTMLSAGEVQRILLLPVSLDRDWSGILAFDRCRDDRAWSTAEVGALQIAAETLAAALKRREAEIHREELQQQLAQSQKLEAVGQLAGGVAHDFNNMLQVIIGYCDIGLSMDECGAVVKNILSEIRGAARRSADLSQQLLTFARRQRVQGLNLDLNHAIPETLTLLKRLVGDQITVHWQPAERPCPVRIDPAQLDQILANLMVNARDAIGSAGDIQISIRPGRILADDSSESPGQEYVELQVRDDGCGMSPEVQARIFEPFYTTKGVGEGSGLGLSTVYGIVQQNKGQIFVKSQPGQGTTVSVILPLAKDTSAGLTRVRDGSDMPGGVEKIILVEDEQLVLSFASQLLRSLGYTIVSFRSPCDVFDDVSLADDPADLLITDVMMPGMDGGELARRLRSSTPGLRCLFMSGFAPETLERQIGPHQRDNVLFKPFSAAELANKVREVLDAPIR